MFINGTSVREFGLKDLNHIVNHCGKTTLGMFPLSIYSELMSSDPLQSVQCICIFSA